MAPVPATEQCGELLISALQELDQEGTGEISMAALDALLQSTDEWWDTEKLRVLSTAAGLMSENGRLRYVDFVEWLTRPAAPNNMRSASKSNRRAASKLTQASASDPAAAMVAVLDEGRGKERAPGSLRVRFVHINDVYNLSHFPSLRTAIRKFGDPDEVDQTVTCLGGDFLAPYLLSQLDEGAGMVECMNKLPISHCCFGNHECDVPHEALLRAITTFEGTWLNSNMKGGGFGAIERLPSKDIIEVTSRDGSQTRRIGLLGLLCGYPSLYREGAFNGAVPSIKNVNEACSELAQDLVDNHNCDVVVPLTHQNGPDDEALVERGRELRVPLILGGHDHCEYCEEASDPSFAALLKAGMDAEKVGVADLIWDSVNTSWPRVEMRLLETDNFERDEKMEEVVKKHMTKVWALDYMVACRKPVMEELVPPGTKFPLSSLNTRSDESSMATFLCSALKAAFRCDCALLDGGSVRANVEKYEDKVTISDLKAELPFTNATVIVDLPGSVLEASVRFSRVKAKEKGKWPFFLHCDAGCQVDPESHGLKTVAGEPFDPERYYSTAVGIDLGVGAGVNQPLMDWANDHPDEIPDHELAQHACEVLELYFLRRLWANLPTFDAIRQRSDDHLFPDEIFDAYKTVFFGDEDLGSAQRKAVEDMVHHLIRAIDKDGDKSTVTRREYNLLLSRGGPAAAHRPCSKTNFAQAH